MKILLASLLICLAIAIPDFSYTEEDGVMVLNDKNIHQVISSYSNLVVEFYAEWCGHCKKFAPKFAKACRLLKEQDPPVYCAKIDADKYKEISKEDFKIDTFPTVKYFKAGEVLSYDGAYNEHALYSFVKTGSALNTPSIDKKELERLREQEDVFYVYFDEGNFKEAFAQSQGSTKIENGNNSSSKNVKVDPNYRLFNMITKFDENRLFFDSNDAELIKEYDLKTPTIVAFRKFDEPVVKLEGEFERLNVMNFIRQKGKARCMHFREIDKTNIFKSKDSAIFLFVDEDSADHQKLISTFCEVAEKDTSPMMYAYAGIKTFEHKDLRRYLNLNDRQLPILCALKWEVAYGMMRFEYDGDVNKLTEDDIHNFKKRFYNGALERHYYDDHVDTWYHLTAPSTIIYDDYETIVNDPDNDVVVYYFSTANTASNIEKFSAPAFLHNELKEVTAELGRPDNLIIGRYEWHKAPPVVAHQSEDNINSLVLYPKGSKQTGIRYTGGKSAKEIKDWLYEHSTVFQDLHPRKEDL